MGWLENYREAQRHPLLTETIVGRSPSADLRLDADFVSSIHATIAWGRGEWSVRDLGSRNGTAVNGELVPPKTRRRLNKGDEVSFGQATSTWTLTDDGQPEAMAVAPDGARVIAQAGLLVLPDAEHPEATVYRGPIGPWRLESGDEELEIEDLHALTLASGRWTLRLPADRPSTRASVSPLRELSLSRARIRLHAADGENGGTIVVDADDETFSFPLGRAVAVLRELAVRRGQPDGGWVDRETLLSDLAMTGNHLNVAIFRLRRQFSEAGFVDAVSIIERSRRRLRLGTDTLTLDPNSDSETRS